MKTKWQQFHHPSALPPCFGPQASWCTVNEAVYHVPHFCAKRWKSFKVLFFFCNLCTGYGRRGCIRLLAFLTLCPAGQCALSESGANQRSVPKCVFCVPESFAILVSSVLMEALQSRASRLLPLLWLSFPLTFILCTPTEAASHPGLGKVQPPLPQLQIMQKGALILISDLEVLGLRLWLAKR